MKVFGYQKDSEKLMELEEVTFQTDIKELDKIIKFLQVIKEQHSKVNGEVECHSHFRDWDDQWNDNSTDLIVVTTKI
ncbi:hypothetical protein CIB95_04975 [Lottiidibacillus patelloidae]|uniref:Uncharacterized protein n=1 Tax=Lottiidibacillus patelloidae TaxID=2670334 RepID=A0A263BVE8_9BACI|nr:hypothetical protein [Lottiidibacillus patelloidae]OZM57721.1 hypothetical protein CIB95_04975 [Lottiidibacillus patelloidae]